jgi:hypothetical protein
MRAELHEVGSGELQIQMVVELPCAERLELRPLSARGYNPRVLECQVLWSRPQGRGFRLGLRTCQPVSGSWLGWRLRTARPQRKRPRIALSTPTPVTLCSASTAVASRLIDLSIGGAQVSTGLDVEVGKAIQLELSSPHQAPVKLSAEVVGVRPVEDGQLVNLRFVRGQGACRRALSRHILALAPAA